MSFLKRKLGWNQILIGELAPDNQEHFICSHLIYLSKFLIVGKI